MPEEIFLIIKKIKSKMKTLNFIPIILLITFLSPNLSAQNNKDWFLLPDGLGLSNQLEYSLTLKIKLRFLKIG